MIKIDIVLAFNPSPISHPHIPKHTNEQWDGGAYGFAGLMSLAGGRRQKNGKMVPWLLILTGRTL